MRCRRSRWGQLMFQFVLVFPSNQSLMCRRAIPPTFCSLVPQRIDVPSLVESVALFSVVNYIPLKFKFKFFPRLAALAPSLRLRPPIPIKDMTVGGVTSFIRFQSLIMIRQCCSRSPPAFTASSAASSCSKGGSCACDKGSCRCSSKPKPIATSPVCACTSCVLAATVSGHREVGFAQLTHLCLTQPSSDRAPLAHVP